MRTSAGLAFTMPFGSSSLHFSVPWLGRVVFLCIAFSGVGCSMLVEASSTTYTISGRVTDGFGNTISNKAVVLSGTQSANTTTDMNGGYSFPNLPAGGNYHVAPALGGQNTLVVGVDVNNLSSDVTADLQVRFF